MTGAFGLARPETDRRVTGDLAFPRAEEVPRAPDGFALLRAILMRTSADGVLISALEQG